MEQSVSVAVPKLTTPPPMLAEFPLKVQLVSIAVPSLNSRRRLRCRVLAEFLLKVQLVSVAVPSLNRPPPPTPAEFPLMVQLVSVAVPSLNSPPPRDCRCGVSADGAVGERRRAVVEHRRRRWG